AERREYTGALRRGRTRAPPLPAHGQPDPYELRQLRGLPYRRLERRVDHRQVELAVAAEPAQRRADVDREAYAGRHGIPSEAAEQPAAPGPQPPPPPPPLRPPPPASPPPPRPP